MRYIKIGHGVCVMEIANLTSQGTWLVFLHTVEIPIL
jgi:hypothetical protein